MSWAQISTSWGELRLNTKNERCRKHSFTCGICIYRKTNIYVIPTILLKCLTYLRRSTDYPNGGFFSLKNCTHVNLTIWELQACFITRFSGTKLIQTILQYLPQIQNPLPVMHAHCEMVWVNSDLTKKLFSCSSIGFQSPNTTKSWIKPTGLTRVRCDQFGGSWTRQTIISHQWHRCIFIQKSWIFRMICLVSPIWRWDSKIWAEKHDSLNGISISTAALVTKENLEPKQFSCFRFYKYKR